MPQQAELFLVGENTGDNRKYKEIFDSCIKSGAEIQKRTGGQPETAGLPSLTSHGKISLTSLGKDSIIK